MELQSVIPASLVYRMSGRIPRISRNPVWKKRNQNKGRGGDSVGIGWVFITSQALSVPVLGVEGYHEGLLSYSLSLMLCVRCWAEMVKKS